MRRRASVLERQALAPVPEAAALVRVEVARHPPGALLGLGAASAAARHPAFLAMASVSYRRRVDRNLSACRSRSSRRTGPRRSRAESVRPRCSRASPARARASSSTGSSTTTPATGCWRWSSSGRKCRRRSGIVAWRRRRRRSTSRAERNWTRGSRRSEQQRRVRRRSVRAEAVSPHRAGTQSGVRDLAGSSPSAGSPRCRRSPAPLLYDRPGLEPGTLAVVQDRDQASGLRMGFHDRRAAPLLRAGGAAGETSLKGRTPPLRPAGRRDSASRTISQRRRAAAVLRGARKLVSGERGDARAPDGGAAPGAGAGTGDRRSRRSRWPASRSSRWRSACRTHAPPRSTCCRRSCDALNDAARAAGRGGAGGRRRSSTDLGRDPSAARRRACRSAFTATITSARCCAPRKTS